MYQIIATEDFIDAVKIIPLKYISILLHSFISIEEMQKEFENNRKDTFMLDLLEQIKNQEIE